MATLPAEEGSRSSRRETITALAYLGVCLGLLTGLAEGALFLLLHHVDHAWGVWTPIVWISALFDLLLFAALGLPLIALALAFPRLSWTRVAVFLYASLAFLDGLALILFQHLDTYAIVLLALGLAAAFTRWSRRHEDLIVWLCRTNTPLLAAAAVLAFVGIEGGSWLHERDALAALPPAAPGSPNVLVLVVDTLRADHLSCYGYDRATSPHIDRLAREGVLFENAYSTAPYTLPSHASMLTGLYPHEHGVEWQSPTTLRHGRYPTLGEALLARGYRTACFSANTFWFTREQGFGRGFLHFEDFFHSPEDAALRTFYGRVFERVVLRQLGCADIPARKSAPDVLRPLLRWVDAAPHPRRPFFAFVNLMDVHDPRLPPQPFRGKFAGGGSPGGQLNWRVKGDDPRLSPEQLQGEIAAYDGAIAYLDDQVGQFLEELRRRGAAENTLVILTSDHGEAFGEHGMFLHAHSLYHEEISIPLIVWGPGQVPAGVRVRQPCSHAAIPATVLDLVSPGVRPVFPGPSLRELWESPGPRRSWPLPLSEMARRDWVTERFPVHSGSMRSVCSCSFHYIEHQTRGASLYDLRQDPKEEHDLASGRVAGEPGSSVPGGKSATAGVLAELKNALRDALSRERLPP